MSTRRGAQLFLWEYRLSAGKPSHKNHENVVFKKLLMMSSSEYLFLESQCSFTKYASQSISVKL